MTGYSLRLVAQQVKAPRGCRYRLVAYATDYDFNHLEFSSLEDLRTCLVSAIPDFDCSELHLPATQDTQVLLSSGISLSHDQIKALGFTMSAR